MTRPQWDKNTVNAAPKRNARLETRTAPDPELLRPSFLPSLADAALTSLRLWNFRRRNADTPA